MATDREIQLLISTKTAGVESFKELSRELKQLAKSGDEAGQRFGELGRQLDQAVKVNNVVSAFGKLTESVGSLRDRLTAAQSAVEQSSAKLQQLNTAAAEAARKQGELQAKVEAARNAWKGYVQDVERNKAEQAKLRTEIEASGKATAEQTAQLAKLRTEEKALVAAKRESNAAYKEAKAALSSFNETVRATLAPLKEAEVEHKKLTAEVDKLTPKLKAQEKALVDVRSALDQAGVETTDFATAQKSAEAQLNKVTEEIRQTKSEIDASRQATERLSNAFNTLKIRSAEDIRNDIARVQQAMETLRTTTGVTGEDINRAMRAAQAEIARLNAELVKTTSEAKTAGSAFDTLRIRSAAQIQADITAIRTALTTMREQVAQGALSMQTLDRASGAASQQLARLRQELVGVSSGLANNGTAAAKLQSAFDTLNIRSAATITADLRKIDAALQIVRQATGGVGSDFERAMGAARQAIMALNAEMTKTVGETSKVQAAFSALNFRPAAQIRQEVESIRTSLQVLRTSGTVSFEDLGRAAIAAESQIARLEAELARTGATLKTTSFYTKETQQAFSTLNIRTSAEIQADVARINAALERLKNSAVVTSAEVQRASRAAALAIKQLQQEAEGPVGRVSEAFSVLRGVVLATIASFALFGTAQLASGLVSVARDAEQTKIALAALTGSMDEAGQRMDYIAGIARKNSLDLVALQQSYVKLEASLKGTSISLEEQNQLFEAVSRYMGLIGSPAEKVTGAFEALSQMASKGTVSLEELRQQLGDRLPGVLNIAADAMGMTTGELTKMIEQGRLTSNDFLPKFSQALLKSADDMQKVVGSTRTMNKAINDLGTAWATLGRAFSETTFYKNLVAGLDLLTKALDSVTQNVGGLSTALNILASVTAGLLAGALAKFIVWAGSAVIALVGTTGTAGIVGALGTLTTALQTAGLAAVMFWVRLLGPFGAVVAGITAIITALMTMGGESEEAANTASTNIEGVGTAAQTTGQSIDRNMTAAMKKVTDATNAVLQAATTAMTALDPVIQKIGQEINALEQKIQQTSQRAVGHINAIGTAYNGLVSIVQQSAQAQILAVQRRYELERGLVETSTQPYAAKESTITQLLINSVTEQNRIRQTQYSDTMRLLNDELRQRVSLTTQAITDEGRRKIAVSQIESDIAQKKITTLQNILSATKANIDALISEERRHLQAIQQIEDEKKRSKMSTEDLIRDLSRQTMTQEQQIMDKMAQAREAESKAIEAQKRGDFETAKTYAQQAVQLNAEVARDQASRAQEAARAVEQAERDMTRAKEIESQARVAYERAAQATTDAERKQYMQEAKRLETEYTSLVQKASQDRQNAAETEAQARAANQQAIKDVAAAEQTYQGVLNAQAGIHQTNASAAKTAYESQQQDVNNLEREVEDLQRIVEEEKTLQITANIDEAKQAIDELEGYVAEKEYLVEIKADLEQAKTDIDGLVKTIKERQDAKLPIDAELKLLEQKLKDVETKVGDLKEWARDKGKIELTASIDKVEKAVRDAQREIEKLDEIKTESTHTVDTSDVARARQEILSLDGMVTHSTHIIHVKRVEENALGGVAGSQVQAFARGGPAFPLMRGGRVPGTGNKDSVARTLPAGSFVLRKAAVAKYGRDSIRKMISGTPALNARVPLPKGKVPALLMPGEEVIPRATVARLGTDFFHSLNTLAAPMLAGIQRFATGGIAGDLRSIIGRKLPVDLAAPGTFDGTANTSKHYVEIKMPSKSYNIQTATQDDAKLLTTALKQLSADLARVM